MSSWYIDRSRNLESIFKDEYFGKLKEFAQNNLSLSTSELIDYLKIGGKNPNAILTFLRDIGIIYIRDDKKNEATDFFKKCLESKLENQYIILLILIKKNSEKADKNTIKPFVVICKILSAFNRKSKRLSLNENQIKSYLMPITSYDQINDALIDDMFKNKNSDEPIRGLDIWMNALLATGMFSGTKHDVCLKNNYIEFINFIATYGDELKPSSSKEEYFLQAASPTYGIYDLVKDHYLEAKEGLRNLESIYRYIESVGNISMFTDLGYNQIIYGIPGCGKSYYVENIILDNEHADRKNVFRTTFYLDYTNSDFIGQIYPKVSNGTVMYEIMPGPFTKALAKAYQNKNKKIYLIIEEINRGNAAAIFGDIFQLLDRLKVDKDGRLRGSSEYPISNQFIESYFEQEKISYEPGQIYIPNNLTILATMNTNDQNVFPLDTAFKRRWKMKRIVNTWENHKFKDYYIPFTDITWQNFVEAVNKKMLEASDDGLFLEDKQLGAYFVSEDLLVKEKDDVCIVNDVNKEKLENFTNKVIEYLYNDVFKFDKGQLFDNKKSFNEVWECINSYDEDDCFNGSKNLCLNINFYNDSEQSI